MMSLTFGLFTQVSGSGPLGPLVLNTVRNIFMRLYGSVEEVVTMCLVYKIGRLLCSYPPHSPPPSLPLPATQNKNKKYIMDFDSLSKFTY